jgi:NAD(P)-dependent dehydrogenase (short-subunit alcohol dehydrogenase family)
VIAACREPKSATDLRKLASSTLAIMELDVADERSVDRFVAVLGVRLVDVLVNNAGIMGGDRQSADDMVYQAWMRAFKVNTIAPFRFTTKLKPNLPLGERPRVVTLSSRMGSLNRKSTDSFAYRSCKAGDGTFKLSSGTTSGYGRYVKSLWRAPWRGANRIGREFPIPLSSLLRGPALALSSLWAPRAVKR